jgi:hypothetical protein
MPIETMPAEEFQFDWSECNYFARRWGWDYELHCFGCVLCWSRYKFWWFAPSIDRPHTLEGLVQFFEAIGGVLAVGRTPHGPARPVPGQRLRLRPGRVVLRPSLRLRLEGL